MSHANARLTVHGRAELVRRVVEQGRPVAHVVVELNVSRATGYKWLARWRAEGPAGLADRPSRAHRLPRKRGGSRRRGRQTTPRYQARARRHRTPHAREWPAMDRDGPCGADAAQAAPTE